MIPSTEIDAYIALQDGQTEPRISKWGATLPLPFEGQAGWNEGTTNTRRECKAHVKHVLDHWIIQLSIILLLIIDLVLILLKDYMKELLTFGLSSIFMIEIILRMWSSGSAVYLSYRLNVFDTVIVVLSWILSVVVMVFEVSTGFLLFQLLRIVRVSRIARIFVRITLFRRTRKKASKHLILQNRQRYVRDGYDLDLAYITPQIIAMSLPTRGKEALYRNHADEVARFLFEKHEKHFWIWNLCIERKYQTDRFEDRVSRIPVKNQSVPRLTTLIAFVRKVSIFLDQNPTNVVAIHCQTGKGRTGTFICCWLVYKYPYLRVEDALRQFAERRTDLTKGSSLQALQTPSQSRYVAYFSYYARTLNLKPHLGLKIKKILIGPFASGYKSLDLLKVLRKEDDVNEEESDAVQQSLHLAENAEHLVEMKEIGEFGETQNREKLKAQITCYPLESTESRWLPQNGSDSLLLTLEEEPGPSPTCLTCSVVKSENYPRYAIFGGLSDYVICGDFQISVSWLEKNVNAEEILFSCFMHTSFLEIDEGGCFAIPKLRLDNLHNDVSDKKVPHEFKLYVKGEIVFRQ